jgi:hypothetical protein
VATATARIFRESFKTPKTLALTKNNVGDLSLVRRCYLSLINVAKNGYPFTIHCSYTSAVLCGSFAVKDQLCLNFCLPDAIGRYKFCFLLFSPQSTQSSAKMREGTHPVRTVRHSLLITHYSLLTACCFLLTCLPAGRLLTAYCLLLTAYCFLLPASCFPLTLLPHSSLTTHYSYLDPYSYLYAMNLEYKYLLPENFSANSRVWIYQSSRKFTLAEALEIESLLNKFSSEWRSHGDEVNSYCNLFFGQFIVFIADETHIRISGCSTDSSVRFIKDLGAKFGVDFFNRTNLAFLIQDKIQLLPMNQLHYAMDNYFINGDTLYFNNLVQTKKDLENHWIIPVKDSWISKKLIPSKG